MITITKSSFFKLDHQNCDKGQEKSLSFSILLFLNDQRVLISVNIEPFSDIKSLSNHIQRIQTVLKQSFPLFSFYFCLFGWLYGLLAYYSIVRRQQSMFQSFLTSIDQQQSSQRPSKQGAPNPKELTLKESIKSLISIMSRNRQLCRQAAINIGLSLSSLDFDKILKLVNGQCNLSTLTFTCSQLKTLQKECIKISKTIGKNEIKADNGPSLFLKKRQPTNNGDQSERKEEEPLDQVQRALEEELAFRIKQKKFTSSDNLLRKTDYLKKRSQKAKSMNKRAFKIYVNHKQKQQKQIQNFKIASEYVKPILLKAEEIFQTTSNTNIVSNSNSLEKDAVRQGMKISIFDDSFRVPTQKCKTAASKYRTRTGDSTVKPEEMDKSEQRFAEYRKKQNQTRERRQQMEWSRQQQTISKFIHKQEKLKQLQNQLQEEQKKKEKKLARIHNQILTSTKTQKFDDDFDYGIKQKCEQKVFKKQIFLNDRVNRIREQQKLKQQRRERFRMRKQREHEQKQSLNEYYLKSYIQRCSRLKDNQFKHQITIRKRHHLLLEKENQDRIAQNLSKLSDAELMKLTQSMRNNEHSRSLNLQSTM